MTMNSTSFTSISSPNDDSLSLGDRVKLNNNSNSKQLQQDNKMADNLESVDYKILDPSNSSNLMRSNRSSNNSESDPDRSPSVTVLTTSSGINHTSLNHHHHHPHRASQLITGGFSLSHRLHLTKHQRTLWSRATSLEKLLLITVLILGTATILLFTSLISILIAQKDSSLSARDQSDDTNGTIKTFHKNSTNYCITPECVKVAASVIEAIDLTVDPCDDFYVSWPVRESPTLALIVN